MTAPATGPPTGSVTFKDGTTTLGSTALTGTSATFQTTSLSTGGHSITAVYGGDTKFSASTSSVLTQNVNANSCVDGFANAFAISGANGSVYGSNASATGEAGEPDHAGNSQPLNSVWCKWAAPANGVVSFDTTGAGFDTTLAVYTGGAVNGLANVAANDNIVAGSNVQSRVSFNAVAGATYFIAVDGAGAATGSYLLSWALAAPTSATYAAILPYARSVQTGTTATAFGTIINAGTTTASQCALAKPPGYPAVFSYQTTNPANQLSGSANTPADIPAGAAQNYVFAITPSQDLNGAETEVIFACANTPVTVSVPGLNTLLLSSAGSATPDLIAIGATVSGDGIVNIPGATAAAFFASAAVNIGPAAAITTSVDDGGRGLALTLTVCQTDPVTGACLSPAAASTTTTFALNQIATFAIFVTGTGNVPFDPANNRLFLRHRDAGGVTRGATNVAVRTFTGPGAVGQALPPQQRAALP